MLTLFELLIAESVAHFAIEHDWQHSPAAGGFHYGDAERLLASIEKELHSRKETNGTSQ